jgi:hypothetical protein
MQFHVCADSFRWGSGVGGDAATPNAAPAPAPARPRPSTAGSDGASSTAPPQSSDTAASAAAVPQQMVLRALVLSLQTVRALRSDLE